MCTTVAAPRRPDAYPVPPATGVPGSGWPSQVRRFVEGDRRWPGQHHGRPADGSRMTSEAANPSAASADAATPVVQLSGVARRFGDVTALHDLDLVVPANRVTVLLGPNGAGKTTA